MDKTFKEKCSSNYTYRGKITKLMETDTLYAIDRPDGVRVYGARCNNGRYSMELGLIKLTEMANEAELSMPDDKVIIRRLPDNTVYLIFVDMSA